ncbi:MAG: hypothetical protein RL641_472 [Candidatus Parcubacteria bacterium]|jgi:hypothetical protein
MEIEQLFSNSIAQAYIFSKNDAQAVLSVIEKKIALTFGASPNAVLYEQESFGIDDSRAVFELANLQSDGETFFAIVTRSLTREAEHSLLKTFEEPKPGVHFLLFVDNPAKLLPTLLSRCILVSEMNSKKSAGRHPAFLKITLPERFAYVEKLSKILKKDDPTAFRDAALEIFDAVIDELSIGLGSKTTPLKREQVERILELRNFLNDRGSSAKQLLETMSMQL